MKAHLRNLNFGLQTLFSSRPKGYFIPYRYATHPTPSAYPALLPLFEAAEPKYKKLLDQLSGLSDNIERFGGAAPNPRFEQDWFPRIDALAAYAFVRRLKPSKIIEIGSGHSTRVMVRAFQDAGANTEMLCIDPSPRAALASLPIKHIAQTVQNAAVDTFAQMQADDILFVDSSHIAMPGSDVDFIINTIIPCLPKGCLVHFHDIFLPNGYPKKWRWRGYNEQIVVSALIQSGAFEVEFASNHLTRYHPSLLNGTLVEQFPLLPGAIESSLWLRKASDATYSAIQKVSGR